MHIVGIKNIFDRKFFRNLNKLFLFDEVSRWIGCKGLRRMTFLGGNFFPEKCIHELDNK